MHVQGSGQGGQASFAAQEQREPLLADELPLEADEVSSRCLIAMQAALALCLCTAWNADCRVRIFVT